MRARRRVSGWSLVEALVVMAIVAIVAGMALPDLYGLLREQRLRTAGSDLLRAIDLARAQALARGHKVKLVPRDARGADWAAGWVVFADRDGDGELGPGDEIIAEHGPLAPGIAVAFAFSSRAAPFYIAYNGAGRSCVDTNGAAARWGTLTLSDGEHARRITINMLGRARMCDPARDASCAGPPSA